MDGCKVHDAGVRVMVVWESMVRTREKVVMFSISFYLVPSLQCHQAYVPPFYFPYFMIIIAHC